MAQKRVKLRPEDIGNQRPEMAPATDLDRLAKHAAANPLLYVAGAAFVVVCLLAAIVFRVSSAQADRRVMTEYADALATEDPALRVAELEPVVQAGGKWGVEALYVLGETAVQAGEYERARTAFERVVNDHADSEYAARAADGLAWLLGNEGKHQDAIAAREKLEQTYPNSFIARLQPFHIGQMHEELEQWDQAVAAYNRQKEIFPDSRIATRAQERLDALKTEHPELFPAEEAATVDGTVQSPAEGSTAAPAAEAPAPAPEAPADVPAPAPEVAPEAAAPVVDGGVENPAPAVQPIVEPSTETAPDTAVTTAEPAQEAASAAENQ